MTNKPAKGVKIIQHRGQVNRSDFYGVPIERLDKIFVLGWKAFVKCAPYEEHFIFEAPRIPVERARAILKSLKAEKARGPQHSEHITTLLGAIKAADERQMVQMPGPSHMCTCGSVAVGINSDNPQGPFIPGSPNALMICYFHQSNGFHTTTVINKDDFEKSAGQILTPKGRKWLI